MKRLFLLLVGLLAIQSSFACSSDNSDIENTSEETIDDGTYFGGRKVLVAYFSWGGTTRRMAQEIQRVTGGDLFEIVPVNPYPTEYTPCTEVALEERDNDARPPIKEKVEGWESYDVVFIGCPVWWHTAPMIISTFAESYNFKGKTVVPFCTYASTYRDETLQKIVDLTPNAKHLTGEGLTSGRINTQTIQTWIDITNEEWNKTHQGVTSLSEVRTKTKRKQSIYSIDGTKRKKPQKGLNIINNKKVIL